MLEQTTKLPLRTAMEARDHAAVVQAFAEDAVLLSPITGKLAFEGREQISALTLVLLDVLDDLRYVDELRVRDRAVLVAAARIGRTELQIVDHLRLDDDDRIKEMTVFFRPLPAIALALRALGTGLARRKSAARAAAIALLATPLVFLTRTADGIGARLVRPTL